ncbi:MAG: ABC transporter permease subunit, partial [Planctomycetota bacterium]|nr:ABC transporter permease subunit [Planctomycetota bacterium]
MRNRAVGLIARKELLDTLRDRRTLFIALVLPLLLYPALLLGLTGIIGATQRNLANDRQKVLIDGVDGTGALAESLRAQALDPVIGDAITAALPTKVAEELATLVADESDAARAQLRQTLKEHGFAGAVICDPGFSENLADAKRAFLTLVFDSTDESSKTARGKVIKGLFEFASARREEVIARFPGQEDLLRFAEQPVKRQNVELASLSQRGAYSFAPMLGLLIVVMALTGAFYPAVDLAAGEKERGTLETLLVAPVTRTEIVLGKFLTIWLIAVVTALLNLLVMGITFSKLAGMVGTGKIAFELPLSAMIAVSIILIPTAALFSAIALALSSFATSYKEGQHYMSPLFLVAMPLAMVALLPNIELSYGIALVPVANVVLLVKSMLLGSEAAGPALVATGAMVAYALASIAVAVSIFKREAVLFRTGAGRGFDASALKASRAGLPSPTQGFLLFMGVLALIFFLSGKVESGAGAVRAFLMTQFIAILLPALLLANRARLNMRATFRAYWPKPADALMAFVAGAAGVFLVIWLYTFMPAREASGFEEVIKLLLDEIPVWMFLCMLAVVPPICEEFLCRGFLLSSFRARFGAKGAVVLSAALFAALHLDVYRLPSTFLAGLILGFILVRTGSILPAILFHMAFNGTIAVAQFVPAVGERFLQL